MIAEPYTMTPEEMLDRDIIGQEGYVQGLVDEAGWFGGYSNELAALEAREQATQAQALALLIRNDFEITYAPFFTQRKKVYDENYNYWQSKQWTDKDIANLLGDGIPPYISNIMKRQIDTLTGEQRAQETDWRAVGKSQEADSHAEFQNHYLRSVAQTNMWNRKKAFVFRDAVIGGTGVASSALDPADPKGNIMLKRERPYEFMWHLETAENGSLEGTKFLERIYSVQRSQVLWEFPMWADKLRDMDSSMYATILPYIDTIMRPKVRRTTNSALANDSVTFDPWQSRLYRQMLLKRELYHRQMIPKWRVTNGYTATHYDVDSKAQAEYIYSQLCEIWSINEAAATGQSPDSIIPRIAEPRFVQVPVIDQQIWVGDQLLAVNRDNDNSSPYHFYIPEYNDGDITSYFEHGKDMQRLRNVSMSVMHKKAAGFKPKLFVNDYYLNSLGMNATQIDEALNNESKAFHIKSSDKEALKNAFYQFNPQNNDGGFYRELIEFTTNDINYYGGGLNAVGAQQAAGESGRAVSARTQQAAVATTNLMDELEYFDKEVGGRVLYLAQFTDPNVAWRAINPDGRPEFQSMAESGIQDVEEMSYSVEIIENTSSPTERFVRLSHLRDALSQLGPDSPMSAPIAMLMFKEMDIDKSERDGILAQVQAQQKQQSDLDNRKQKLDEDQARFEQWKGTEDRKLKWKQLEIEELKIKTPNVSVAFKPMDTPAPILADVLNQWQPDLNADPMGVLGAQALHAKFGQEVIDLQQQRRNELMTPAQKKIEALKAKPPKMVSSAEDTANRRNKDLK